MKFLYLDESGDDGEKGSKFYVLGGLIVDCNNLPALQKEVRDLVKSTFKHWKRIRSSNMYFKSEFEKERKLPKEFENLGLDKPELHYTALIAEDPPYDRLDGLGRKQLADSVIMLAKKFGEKIVGVALDKKRHSEKYVVPKPVDLFAIEMMAERFQAYLKIVNDVGIFVYDQKDKHNNIVFRNFVDFIRTDGTAHSKLGRIIENLMFQPSELSEGLQLADFVAHSIFMKYEQGRTQRYDELDSHIFSMKLFPAEERRAT